MIKMSLLAQKYKTDFNIKLTNRIILKNPVLNIFVIANLTKRRKKILMTWWFLAHEPCNETFELVG